jgi:hypothetical protein
LSGRAIDPLTSLCGGGGGGWQVSSSRALLFCEFDLVFDLFELTVGNTDCRTLSKLAAFSSLL